VAAVSRTIVAAEQHANREALLAADAARVAERERVERQREAADRDARRDEARKLRRLCAAERERAAR